MTGVEVDMVVTDSRAALALYEKIFEVKRIEVTSYGKGFNEAVFSMYGTRFHLLDENPQYQLAAPKPDDPKSVWVNIVVPDISATFAKAVDAGCTKVQEITEMASFATSNAIFSDPFGHLWMLHQVGQKTSFEERIDIFS
jgi:uncharacterized glyoxalase superfamily protein PhnB